MGYVSLTDAQLTANGFIKQATGRQIRDNQDDHEARISELLASSDNCIIDDFFSIALGGWGTGAYPPVSMMNVDGSHVLKFDSDGSVRNVYLQGPPRLRLNQDMSLFVESRCKEPGTTAMPNVLLGLQDLGVAAGAEVTDENNVIGFLKGSTAGKWRFRCASGGVASQTDNIGNRATWQSLRAEIVRSGGGTTLQVRAYIDDAEISGSPFTTNVPTSVVLMPIFGAYTAADTACDMRLDRVEMRWAAVPVNS